MSRYEKIVKKLLQSRGVEVNGYRPHDIQVHNSGFYKRVVQYGSLGFGEAYMDGWWDTEDLFLLMKRIHLIDKKKLVRQHWTDAFLCPLLPVSSLVVNPQNKRRSFRVGQQHYDIGNELYSAMLGRYKVYSCGFWEDAQTLDEAQRHKLDLSFRKLKIEEGMDVLDIGCGWGSFAFYAAERGAKVTGITVSKEQKKWIDQNKGDLPIKVVYDDYRNYLSAPSRSQFFDRISSIGQFEHVGPKNYGDYFRLTHNRLKSDGFMLLHTILGEQPASRIDPWLEKYIFPGAVLPAEFQIDIAARKNGWQKEDEHRFGPYYTNTLLAWWENFDQWYEQASIDRTKYDERFYRKWKIYLIGCAALFAVRKTNLGQFIFSKTPDTGLPPDFYQPLVR